MNKWVIGILAVLLIVGAGFGVSKVVSSDYKEQPGVVYEDDSSYNGVFY